MVEVFKTSVNDYTHAQRLISEIRKAFPSYKANFDLDDCDNILRIECVNEVEINYLIKLLDNHNCEAEVLMDMV